MADQDRRIRRTRRIFNEALLSLIPEKGYEHITVQDILNRADIGRSTFYAHYRDKEALLIAGFDELRDDLQRELDAMAPGVPAPDPGSPTAVIFEHAYRNRHIYQALCGKQGGNVVHRHLHRLIGDLLRAHLRPHLIAAGSDLPADAVAEFYTSAALGLLTWWVDKDFRHGPTRLANIYQQLAAPGVRAALDHQPLLGTPPAKPRRSTGTK